jgi:O-antigen ligase/tetratricopeptide (TPR) repeat protein
MLQTSASWGSNARKVEQTSAASLLRVVDAGLCGIVFVAPYFFGGRHDVGRLVFVSFVAVTAVAWFARQATLPSARWPRTFAYGVLLLTAALVALQIVPLPAEWITRLSPRTGQLLPIWNDGSSSSVCLGSWRTLSLVPHETTKALALLLSYCLLFVVVVGRIVVRADVRRLLNWIGISSVAMAVFGLLQYATSDGHFFWFYEVAHRSTAQSLAGPFINRNHFADFLVLGLAPLVTLIPVAGSGAKGLLTGRRIEIDAKALLIRWSLFAAVALVFTTVVLTRSRGGAVALLASGSILFSIYATRGLINRNSIYGLAGLALVVAGVLALHGGDQISSTLDDFTDGSLEKIDRDGIRRLIWTANIDAFKAGWLTGAGVGSHSEFCQIYMPNYFTRDYTHAENGYLQIASESGSGGLALFVVGIGFLSTWCFHAWRSADNPENIQLLGAVCAGLGASLVHSVVDFVWYIPACMSVVVVLAACALRLAQLSSPSKIENRLCESVLPRGRWFELALAAILVGAWCVHTYFGPAIAAVHWDRYRRASVANSDAARQQTLDQLNHRDADDASGQSALNNLMLRELEQVVYWDPQFARAHLKLARRCVAQFEIEQSRSENAIGLSQLCDTVRHSKFESPAALKAWLGRAVGKNLPWLERAAAEARRAVELCPLQGEGYVYLAQQSWLEGGSAVAARELFDQALRVRPHNADVLFEIGRQELAANNRTAAIEHWQMCFSDPGPHQLKIIQLRGGDLPAAQFTSIFQPDWPLLRIVWLRYRDAGTMEDLESLLTYAVQKTESATAGIGAPSPAFVWFWQSLMFSDLDRKEQAQFCLQRAYELDPRQYAIRRALGQVLFASGRFAEAEPHFRWCFARRPADKNLAAALSKISKARIDFRAQPGPTSTRPAVDKAVAPVSYTSNFSN